MYIYLIISVFSWGTCENLAAPNYYAGGWEETRNEDVAKDEEQTNISPGNGWQITFISRETFIQCYFFEYKGM